MLFSFICGTLSLNRKVIYHLEGDSDNGNRKAY
nr:MAG TPA: hypothetical protein [Caudoviricetes sp.]